jgi:hypothetical protein
MSRALRRTSLVLMWLLLALLPLRGWANLTMHLPATDMPVMAPCHGAEAAADPADVSQPCTLCDVCHGAMLLASHVPPLKDPQTQPLPAAAPLPMLVAEPDALFRPPRR